jgi:hypothetical protein
LEGFEMTFLIEHDKKCFFNKALFVNMITYGWFFVLLFVPLVSPILLSSEVQASAKKTNPSLEFLDDGTLTMDAQGVPLATVLGDIQEKTNLQFKIHESLLEQPISVRFQSLPLNKAIGRILHGVSYACIFSLSGNIETVITFPAINEVKESSSYRDIPNIGLSYEATMEFLPPSEDEDMGDATEIMPPEEPEDFLEAMGNMPSYEEESTGEDVGFVFPSEEDNP